MLPAQLANRRQIAIRGYLHTTLALNRLDDDGRGPGIDHLAQSVEITVGNKHVVGKQWPVTCRGRGASETARVFRVRPWKAPRVVTTRVRPVSLRAILMATSIASAPLLTKYRRDSGAGSNGARRASSCALMGE